MAGLVFSPPEAPHSQALPGSAVEVLIRQSEDFGFNIGSGPPKIAAGGTESAMLLPFFFAIVVRD